MATKMFWNRFTFIRVLLLLLAVLLVALLISAFMTRIFMIAQRQWIYDGFDPLQIVVAGKNLHPGAPLVSGMIENRSVPRAFVHANAIYPEEINLILGRKLWVPVRAGDPVLWQDFHRRDAGSPGTVFSPAPGRIDTAPGEADPERQKEESLLGSKAVFVTKGLYKGDLGGLAGADAFCQAEASEAGLAGTYRAWLSGPAASPASRFTHARVEYRLVKGHVVAGNWEALTDGMIDHAINMTAAGVVMKARPVWTNTNPDGTPRNKKDEPRIDTCDQWASEELGMFGATGSSLATDESWTYARLGLSCNVPAVLYCFQQ